MTLKNHFNDLTAKEWLPFQKSWFVDQGTTDLYRKNLRFFTKPSNGKTRVQYLGTDRDLFQQLVAKQNLELVNGDQTDFAIWDLRDRWSDLTQYRSDKSSLLATAEELFKALNDQGFCCVLVNQLETKDGFHPVAWDLAKSLSQLFSLKDEKIGWHQDANTCYYALYFRKDKQSAGKLDTTCLEALNSLSDPVPKLPRGRIIKPKRRSNEEIFHPAKFPETLVQPFIEAFTTKGENVFDPMCGTGSSQKAALQCGRSGFGVELNPVFACLADQRLDETERAVDTQHQVLNQDIRNLSYDQLPTMDYIITSPPYWDILNAKGGKGQATRKAKGIPTAYSEAPEDLGNIKKYADFLTELSTVFDTAGRCLKPGGYLTVVVKNVKKQGHNYPLAWDLAEMLVQHGWEMIPERFWFQDDQSLFPYGYFKTWVSNTFHHYCLTFRKPDLLAS